ncbi:C40 family peptidase [Streptosporangium soli]|nr:C40 family peptidase [Streptosporangium sp. KLBMP 9127]
MLDEGARMTFVVPHPFPPPPPPPPRRSRLARRAVPVIAVLAVGVLAADLMVLNNLTPRDDGRVVATVQRAPQRVSSGYVAEAAPSRVVEPLGELRKPHLFVVARRPLTKASLARVAKVKGVKAVELADAAEVMLDGKRVQTLGVDPSTFRAYTPSPTAKSDALWSNVAAGDVAVSFVLGNDGGLTLGRTVGTAGRTLRIGAYATMGMGSIDAVVSRPTARTLGIPQNNALVISAPKKDTTKLRAALLRVLPKGTQIATMNPVLTPPPPKGRTQTQPRATWPTGSLMSVPQVETALKAAISKLGRPYVWGAEGPDTFDCSGLVQWAYAQAGVRMPRVTHQQFVTGPQVPLAQAQPGDLLFWRHDPTNPGYISHVAIYWGDGKMLHAPRTGDVVKIAPVGTRNLAGVIRVSPQVAARAR